METEAIKILSNYGALGAFGILSIMLLVYVLKANEKRESLFQSFLMKMSENMPSLIVVCGRIEERQDAHIAKTNESFSEVKAKLERRE